MALPASTLPQPPWPWIDPDTGRPTQAFLQFMSTLLLSLNNLNNTIGPLKEAADNNAAATAGVPIGGLYQTTIVVGPPAQVTVKIRTA